MGTGYNEVVYVFILKLKIKTLIKNSLKGITLIEVLVVVLIVSLLSGILVADFPKIRRQFALTRVAYKMSQDLRRTQDMGLSGQRVEGLDVKGYGVYVNLDDLNLGNKKYIIYADINDDQQYVQKTDFIIEEISFGQTELGVIIDRIANTDNRWIDINFKPPNPTITITSLLPNTNQAQIIFGLESDPSNERIISVNTSGLIEVK